VTSILDFLTELWHNHPQVFYIFGGWYVYNCAVQALPKPSTTAGAGYIWLYNFSQGLASNWGLVLKTVQDRRWQKSVDAENGATK
jgi:hypothetical protein